MRILRIGLLAFLALFLGAALFIGWQYWQLASPPLSRLALDEEYPGLPANDSRHYIILPIDHQEPELGSFKSFYLLSPAVKKGGDLIFFLTDGQQELVGPHGDFSFFEKELGGLPYVIIGRRGHSPTLFPEVYNQDGSFDPARAMRLYGSDQHIEDIERVRLDLIKNGYLTPDRKIMLFGGSGAGFLVQQYLAGYGENVSRALILVSGAPDLALANGIANTHNFADFNPAAARILDRLPAESGKFDAQLSWLLYQIGRNEPNPQEKQTELLQLLAAGKSFDYLLYRLKPQYSLALADTILKFPAGCCAKVRMYELVRADLQRYAEFADKRNLVLEFSRHLLADLIAADAAGKLAPQNLQIDRAGFRGQVLVVSASNDVACPPAIGRLIAQSYPDSRFALFADGHRMFFNRDFHLALRKVFFEEGFASENFQKLFSSDLIIDSDVGRTAE